LYWKSTMKKHFVWSLAGSCLVVTLSGTVLAREGDAPSVTANVGVPDTAQIRQSMSALAVPFEAYTGQQDERVAFRAHMRPPGMSKGGEACSAGCAWEAAAGAGGAAGV
jgi:hypothetical protein